MAGLTGHDGHDRYDGHGGHGGIGGYEQGVSGDAVELVVDAQRLVTPEGVRPGRMLVGGGRILALVPAGTPVPTTADRLITGDHYVLPGLIDSHVHFRTPGLTHKEDWAHGSRAAVAGGVTTVIDMPNTEPPTLTEELVREKAALVAGASLVDHTFHIGVDPEDPDRLATLPPGLVAGAKLFMTGHHTARTVVRESDRLDRAFAAAAAGGVRLVLHAEDDGLFALLDAWRGEPRSYRDYETHRPRSGGIVAVSKVLDLVTRHGTAAHVLHVSSAEEVELLSAARAAGLPVTFELTPHHLSFVDEDTLRLGARTRLSPAIRGRGDQDRLWQALFHGECATLGSDHAPHTLAEKSLPVAAAPPGLPGVQELASVVWTGMRRRLPHEDTATALRRLVRVLAEEPARLFGLSGKGRLEAGADADFVVFDPDETWMLTQGQLYSRCGWSAYEGWTLTGRARRTFRAGHQVWNAGDAAFGPATGRWLGARTREEVAR